MIGKFNPAVVIVGLYPGAYWRISDPYTLFNESLLVRSSQMKNIRMFGKDGYINTPFFSGRTVFLDLWLGKNFWTGQLVLRSAANIKDKLLNIFASRRDALNARAHVEPLLSELEMINAAARRAKVRLAVLLVNAQSVDGKFEKIDRRYNALISEFCRTRNIPVLDLLPVLEKLSGGRPVFRHPDDSHWNAAANRVAARQLSSFLFSHRLID